MLVLSSVLVILSVIYFFVSRKKNFIILAFFFLVLLAGLRSYMVGPDGSVYADYFKMLQSMKFSDIPVYFTKEPTFYVTTKYLQNLGVGLQGWYTIIGAVYAFAVCIVIYKYSVNPLISILTLFSLGYFVFSFTGLRQTVALSIVLLSVVLLEQNRYILYIIFVLIAMLFHNSAIIFLLMLFLQKRNFSKKQYLLFWILGIIFTRIFSAQIYTFINQFLEDTERFEGYSNYTYGLSWSGFIIQSVVFLFCLYCMNAEGLKKNRIFLNLSFVGLLFQMCAVLIAEMFRLSMYFSIFNIILVANVCVQNRFTKESKRIADFFIVSTIILYFINSHIGYQYIFYWQ